MPRLTQAKSAPPRRGAFALEPAQGPLEPHAAPPEFGFVQHSPDGIGYWDLERRMPSGLSPEAQCEHLQQHASLVSFNPPLGRLLARSDGEELTGLSLRTFVQREHPGRPDLLREFVHSGYLLEGLAVLGGAQPPERATQPRYGDRLHGVFEGEDLRGIWLTRQRILLDEAAQHVLREREDHYRHSVELSPQVPWTADPQGNILDVNRRWLELTGLSREEALGQGWANAQHPDDYPLMVRSWGHALQSGIPYDIEHRIRTASGEYRWMRSQAYPRRNAGGQIVRWYGSTEDIEARRQAETELREREERYRTLFESIDQGFCILEMLYDPQGQAQDYRFLEVNPTFERHTGLRGAVGRTALELVPGLEWHWIEIYDTVARTGQGQHFERGSLAMGKVFEVSAVRVGASQGRKVAVIFTDITERRRRVYNAQVLSEIVAELLESASAAELLERAAQKLARHLSLSRCSFSRIDREHDLLVVLHDWRRSEALPSLLGNHHLSTYLSPALVERYATGELEAIHDVRAHSQLAATPDQLAALGIASVIHAPHLDQEGHWTFLLSACRSEARQWRDDELELIGELSTRIALWYERFRTEEELRRSELRYRELSESQKRFVNDAAHELRAPLTAIQGNLELMGLYKHMSTEDREEALSEVSAEAVRLSRLVNDMLALARGDAGQRLRLEPLRLDLLLENAHTTACAMDSGHSLSLGQLPEVELSGDPDRLAQLALILLENALHYTPEGGRVDLSLERLEGKVIFRVSDSGIGVAPEELEQVFERFYRSDKARTRSSGGSGLGLSIAQWIVQQHGGRIWLESELGVGTVACVELPLP